MRLLILLFTISMLSACQGTPIKHFEELKPGMEKTEVIEKMGSPWTTTRLHGKDRWIYVLYDDDTRYEKEVHFLNGKVVYVGDTWKPVEEKQADVVDKKKEEDEKKFQEETQKAREENKNAYTNYEKDIKGEGKKV